MLKEYQNYIWLHLIVLIWGLTGIFGKLITLDSGSLVWYRLLIAIAGIGIYFVYRKHNVVVSKKNLLKFFGVGFIIAIHWVTFFESVKQSNVSVALVCFSTGTLFASILEPIFFKRKVKWYEVLFGFFIVGGILCIFSFEFQYKLGISLAIFSAFLASLFTVCNGLLIRETNAKTISFYELIGSLVLVSIYLIAQGKFNSNLFNVSWSDFQWLLILGLLCTAFAFIKSVDLMKELTPYTITISVNMEPIYSIIIAIIIWPESEVMSVGFYIGTAIILTTIFLNAWYKRRERLNQKKLLL